MLPSLVAALLGLWLVWAGVLDPGLIAGSHWIVSLSAVALIVFGALALRSDLLKWPGVSDIAVGVILLALSVTPDASSSPLVTFWALFWGGSVAGIVSLWSAFYRRSSPLRSIGD